eukprot:gb/GFBE01034114.1/.p1 GENE.gb/GFBE01034114.1/~~gb/GFBE01034114.1/.p1  ORF type:complete len:293 (+),score=52.39 gb/GFBE01034114.1/:1-879(+)
MAETVKRRRITRDFNELMQRQRERAAEGSVFESEAAASTADASFHSAAEAPASLTEFVKPAGQSRADVSSEVQTEERSTPGPPAAGSVARRRRTKQAETVGEAATSQSLGVAVLEEPPARKRRRSKQAEVAPSNTPSPPRTLDASQMPLSSVDGNAKSEKDAGPSAADAGASPAEAADVATASCTGVAALTQQFDEIVRASAAPVPQSPGRRLRTKQARCAEEELPQAPAEVSSGSASRKRPAETALAEETIEEQSQKRRRVYSLSSISRTIGLQRVSEALGCARRSTAQSE